MTMFRSLRFRESLTPSRLLVVSFLGLIIAGTVGLKVIPGLYAGPSLSWTDALFTATSAVCVTGLIVVDTAEYFTFWGQAFLLLLIQLGGLGILTFASLAILALGKRLSLHHEALAREPTRLWPDMGVKGILRSLLVFTLAVEGAGAALLFASLSRGFPAGEALWHAVFHSVSAFCNAGFSTFSDSLEGQAGSWPVLLVVMGLIALGGLGFLTLREVWVVLTRRPRERRILSLHSKLVLSTTAALLLLGWGLFLLLEWNNTLRTFPAGGRVWNALFMSVTARTAGFATMSYGETTDPTNFVTILLMSVGGSPGSTAGGLKTTTFAIIGLLAVARLRGTRTPGAWARSVPEETVQRAVGLFVLAFGTVTVGILLLSILEAGGGGGDFLGQMFEMVSAFNTVGLTTGVTATLGGAGKALAVVLMFLGRVGPLTVAMALARERVNGGREFRYGYEHVMIG